MPICGGPPTGRKAEIKLGQIAVILFASQRSIARPTGKDPHSAAKDTFHIAPRSPFPILAPGLMAGALVSTNFPFVSETHSSPFCPSASETKYRIFTVRCKVVPLGNCWPERLVWERRCPKSLFCRALPCQPIEKQLFEGFVFGAHQMAERVASGQMAELLSHVFDVVAGAFQGVGHGEHV